MVAKDRKQWGQWRYSHETQALDFQGDVPYQVALDRCQTAGQIVDWLLQLAGKGWETPEDLGHFVMALQDLSSGKLQATLARGETFDWAAHLRGG